MVDIIITWDLKLESANLTFSQGRSNGGGAISNTGGV